MSASYASLSESIRKARNVRIYKNKDTAYDFKLYPFGERGTYIAPELIREITHNLAEAVTEQFPDFDYIVSLNPAVIPGGCWLPIS